MKKTKRVTRITEALNNLSRTDIYSLMLFVLYKIKDNPEYLTLTELCYLVDGPSLSKLFAYFGGMTITIPTLRDMRLITQGLTLFQYVNLEHGDFEEGLKVIANDEFSADELKNIYTKILEVVKDYDFKRES